MKKRILYSGEGKVFYDIISNSKYSNEEVCSLLNISNGTLYNYYSKTELPVNFKQKVIKLFNTNEDVFFVENTNSPTTTQEPEHTYIHKAPQHTKIPYFDIDMMSGGMSLKAAAEKTSTPLHFMDIPHFTGCISFPVFTQSMMPAIPPGSVLFCKQVTFWREVLEYGQVYAIQLQDNRKFLRRVRKSPADDSLLLVADDPSRFEDILIPKTIINEVWLVEGHMIKHVQ